MQWRRKWQPTPVFLPGESQGWGSLVGCRLWGRDLAAAAKLTKRETLYHLLMPKHSYFSAMHLMFMEVPRRILCDYLGQVPV